MSKEREQKENGTVPRLSTGKGKEKENTRSVAELVFLQLNMYFPGWNK